VHLRRRVCQAEDDRVLGHRRDDVLGHAAAGEADVDVRPVHDRGQRPPAAGGVRRVRGQRSLAGVHVRAVAVQHSGAVEDRDVPVAGREQDPGDRHAGSAGAGDDDAHRVVVLAGEPHRVLQRGEHDDRGAVLVVVEHRDVQPLLEPLLDLEAARSGDVLEVDATEARREPHDRLDDLVDIGRVEADRDGVDAAELLEQHGLALHHRHRRARPDVAEPEHGSAVRDDCHRVRGPGVVAVQRRVLGDRLAHPGDTRGVSQGQLDGTVQRDRRRDLHLAAGVQLEDGVVRAGILQIGHRVKCNHEVGSLVTWLVA
jgi:hypothetical protein